MKQWSPVQISILSQIFEWAGKHDRNWFWSKGLLDPSATRGNDEDVNSAIPNKTLNINSREIRWILDHCGVFEGSIEFEKINYVRSDEYGALEGPMNLEPCEDRWIWSPVRADELGSLWGPTKLWTELIVRSRETFTIFICSVSEHGLVFRQTKMWT